MNHYSLNSTPILSVDFVDEDGAAADPSSVTLVVTKPDATTTTYTTADLDNPSVGTWSKTIVANQSGTWSYVFTGTGDVAASSSGSFSVGAFTPPTARPSGGLCATWANVTDACDCSDVDDSVLYGWIDAASTVLYALTGYRWAGECSDLVYPTSEECLYWLGMTRRSGMLGRRERRSLKLPGYPVVEVTEVLIDGVAVDPDRYRVDDQQYLVYQPGSLNSGDQNWPVTNDVRVPPGSVDTWSVEYVYGVAPPPGGKEAAAALGCELAKSCSADTEDCRLPERVTSITRQGVTMAVLDPLTLFQDGLTGLPEVDLWVSAMNRDNARRPAQVWVPGQRRKVRRTGGTPLDYYGGGY